MRANEGFASVRATFPQGAFMSCRYPNEPHLQRTAESNTWHPRYPGVDDEQLRAADEAAGILPLRHNTNGTRPLPVPFSQRPGYEEEGSMQT